ncbi:MAG TPA: hypothetical protein PKH02_08075 [Bacteroidales bacterium]|nr:hypothetical protein [Bacteroidales bacterium]
MKRRIVFSRVLLLFMVLLVAVPDAGLYAQRRHGDPITGHGVWHRKVKKTKAKTVVKKTPRGKAGKAVRTQAKKAKALDKKNAKADKKLKDHHFAIQNKSTQDRMVNNRKKTDETYKAKRQKIKKESRRPKNHSRP